MSVSTDSSDWGSPDKLLGNFTVSQTLFKTETIALGLQSQENQVFPSLLIEEKGINNSNQKTAQHFCSHILSWDVYQKEPRLHKAILSKLSRHVVHVIDCSISSAAHDTLQTNPWLLCCTAICLFWRLGNTNKLLLACQQTGGKYNQGAPSSYWAQQRAR